MSQVKINCIAIIGKQDNPLYIKNFNSSHPDLKYHYIAHTSCDLLDERTASSTKLADTYLGLLFTIQDLVVYGYVTNSKIKFVLVLGVLDSRTSIRDSDIKNIFKSIHMAWIAQLSNPFFNFPEIETSSSLLLSSLASPNILSPSHAPSSPALPSTSQLPGSSQVSKSFMAEITEIGNRVLGGTMTSF